VEGVFWERHEQGTLLSGTETELPEARWEFGPLSKLVAGDLLYVQQELNLCCHCGCQVMVAPVPFPLLPPSRPYPRRDVLTPLFNCFCPANRLGEATSLGPTGQRAITVTPSFAPGPGRPPPSPSPPTRLHPPPPRRPPPPAAERQAAGAVVGRAEGHRQAGLPLDGRFTNGAEVLRVRDGAELHRPAPPAPWRAGPSGTASRRTFCLADAELRLAGVGGPAFPAQDRARGRAGRLAAGDASGAVHGAGHRAGCSDSDAPMPRSCPVADVGGRARGAAHAARTCQCSTAAGPGSSTRRRAARRRWRSRGSRTGRCGVGSAATTGPPSQRHQPEPAGGGTAPAHRRAARRHSGMRALLQVHQARPGQQLPQAADYI
jgi:hypothetical protein